MLQVEREAHTCVGGASARVGDSRRQDRITNYETCGPYSSCYCIVHTYPADADTLRKPFHALGQRVRDDHGARMTRCWPD